MHLCPPGGSNAISCPLPIHLQAATETVQTASERLIPIGHLRWLCPALGEQARHERQQVLQGLERSCLPRHDMLYAAGYPPCRDIGLGAKLHHKGPMGG